MLFLSEQIDNGRLLAAQHLGLEEVPVICLKHLNPKQVRSCRVADNRLAEFSGWDDELLTAELQRPMPPASTRA